jgi:DNA-directed RNA polymerase specialized sigma24 family protein
MTEELFGRGDPVIRRFQQAFAHEEPATDLAAIIQRAAHSSHPEGLDPLAMESPEDTDVMAAFERLSPDQREVLLLSMVAGLTAAEVAAAPGKTVGAVKALRHRGLASLARVLGRTEPNGACALP